MDIYNNYSINYEYKGVLLKHLKDFGSVINFEKDTLIEFEFKKLDYVYLILDGVVKQFFIDTNGNEKTILILSSGDMFGEITMFQQDYDRVITKTYLDTKVCKIKRDVLFEYLTEHPSVYDSIILMITTKFRILMFQIYDKVYFNVKDRLYFLLRRLSVQQGSSNKTISEINSALTHDELANMIGSTRSTVTKAMGILEAEGKIIKNGKKFIVCK